MAPQPKNEPKKPWWTILLAQIGIVILLLALLALLITVILFWPSSDSDADTNATDVMSFRKDSLSIVITAFSAWIAATVAFLFSTDALKTFAASAGGKPRSPEDKLWQFAVGVLQLRKIPWTVKLSEQVADVRKKVESTPDHFFITVVDDKGALKNIVHKEALDAAVGALVSKRGPYSDPNIWNQTTIDVLVANVNSKTMNQLIKEIDADEERRKKYLDIYVSATLYTTMGLVYQQLKDKELDLGIVVDDKKHPTNWFTIEDIKQEMG